jgi:hypothetical protein
MNARAPAPDLLAEIFGESDHVHAGLAQLEQGRPLWGERAEWIELENRAAQLRMLQAAAESKLTVEHNDVFVVILEKFIRPTMRLRDKMAHWCWGHSPLLPDDLLLVQPDEKTPRHFRAIAGAFELDRERYLSSPASTWIASFATAIPHRTISPALSRRFGLCIPRKSALDGLICYPLRLGFRNLWVTVGRPGKGF